MIEIRASEVRSPAMRSMEVVERKGLGHPDTLADLVAETFCHRYSAYCRDRFGFVPNHSADKVTLAGADAIVRLGAYEIVQPIGAYFFGKVTRRIGSVEVPVEEIFEAAVHDVLRVGTQCPEIVNHVKTHVRAVVGNPIDHHPGYYSPESVVQLRSIAETERLANDTVACAAGAGRTQVEQLVLDLEHYMQGKDFRNHVDGTGSDIKVLAVRRNTHVDVTLCLPFHPEEIDSWSTYDDRLAKARSLIDDFITGHHSAELTSHTLNLNQRDVPGRGYLAPFGTCLGKGDVGAVGRGNRYSGLISTSRAMSIEAPAGKNVMHHTGKIYTVLAQWIADGIHQDFGVDNEVVVTSRVGNPLPAPSHVLVNLAGATDAVEKIRDRVAERIADAERVSEVLIATDPLTVVIQTYW